MAGNNSIQILRGNNVKTNSTINKQTLLDGQPLYDRSTGYLFVGEGNTIANTTAVNAHYANSAGTASSATVANTRNRLYFNGNGSNVSWNGSSVDTIYVPTSVGSSGQVWGVRSNGTVGWVAQTEVPGTIDHANTADAANIANTANVAKKLTNPLYFNGTYTNGSAYSIMWNGDRTDTIYVPTALGTVGQVWGMTSIGRAGWIDQEEIPGTVENANYANYAGVAYNVSARDAATNLYICGPSTAATNITSAAINLNAYANITMNANNYININSGSILRINGSSILDIRSGGEVRIYSNLARIFANEINISTKSTGQSVSINGYNVNVDGNNSVNLTSTVTTSISSRSILELAAPSITFSNMPTVNGVAINNRANVAGRVENNLYFNGTHLNGVAYNTPWNGSTSDVIYVPTALGYTKQVWGMVNRDEVGWMDSPGFEYQGFIDSNGYSLSGKRVLAVCTYGSGEAYIRRGITNVVTGIRGPVVSIDATRGSDSSVVYTASNGAPSYATFNGSSSVFQAPGGTRWSIFTYSSI